MTKCQLHVKDTDNLTRLIIIDKSAVFGYKEGENLCPWQVADQLSY